MKAVKHGVAMATIGSGISEEGAVIEQVQILWETHEINGSKRPSAQMCKVFKAREGKKGK